MTFEKEREIVMQMAKIMQKGETDRERGELDCAQYKWKDILSVGMQRIAGAKALVENGYAKKSDVVADTILRIDAVIDDFDNSELKCHVEDTLKSIAEENNLDLRYTVGGYIAEYEEVLTIKFEVCEYSGEDGRCTNIWKFDSNKGSEAIALYKEKEKKGELVRLIHTTSNDGIREEKIVASTFGPMVD